MASVEKAAQSLLEMYRHLIKRDSELSVTPETITPQMALILYGDAFLRDRHPNASEKSSQDYLRALSRFFRVLPNSPMAGFQEREIAKAIQEARPSRQTLKISKSFWAYCIDSRRCTGRNPFPEEGRQRKSAAARQAAADRLEVLDNEMQEAVYRRLLEEAGGASCGVALMLWGGVDARTACALLWKDLVFFEDGIVMVKLTIEDNAGATHDYSRVLSPQGAEVLAKRRKALVRLVGKTRLAKMPVVSVASDPGKLMKVDDLKQYGKALLKRIGVERRAIGYSERKSVDIAAKVLENTYAHNLIHRCGLREDEGLFSLPLRQIACRERDGRSLPFLYRPRRDRTAALRAAEDGAGEEDQAQKTHRQERSGIRFILLRRLDYAGAAEFGYHGRRTCAG